MYLKPISLDGITRKQTIKLRILNFQLDLNQHQYHLPKLEEVSTFHSKREKNLNPKMKFTNFVDLGSLVEFVTSTTTAAHLHFYLGMERVAIIHV